MLLKKDKIYSRFTFLTKFVCCRISFLIRVIKTTGYKLHLPFGETMILIDRSPTLRERHLSVNLSPLLCW